VALTTTPQPQPPQALPPDGIFGGPLHLADNVRVAIEAALARYVLIGKSGAGKTNGDTVLAEEFISVGVPVVIFDTLGNMRGMRSSVDGLRAGIPIPIFGGPAGDYPLYGGDAPALAEICAQGYSAIFDLSQFTLDDQRDFVADFLPTFKACIRIPMHVIFEEAERFAPRTMRSEAHARAYAATTVFARECRNATVGWTFSTQRPHLLAHDVIDSSSAFIALRSTGESATDAIGAESATRIGRASSRRILDGLGTLRSGEAWLIAEADWLGDSDAEAHPVKFRFRWRKTWESSYKLKIGEPRREPAVRADVDLTPFAPLFEAVPVQSGASDADESVPDEVAGDLASAGSGNHLACLTSKQRAVVDLVLTGETTDAICEQLALKRASVQYRLGAAFRRLGVTNRNELLTKLQSADLDTPVFSVDNDRIKRLEERIVSLEAELAQRDHAPGSDEGSHLTAFACNGFGRAPNEARAVLLALLQALPETHVPRQTLAESCATTPTDSLFQSAIEDMQSAGWIHLRPGRGVGLTPAAVRTLAPLDKLWDVIQPVAAA
jgi:DNA-binding CsgD family transcriptional regulator